ASKPRLALAGSIGSATVTAPTLPSALMSISSSTSAVMPLSSAGFGYSASTNFLTLGSLVSLVASIWLLGGGGVGGGGGASSIWAGAPRAAVARRIKTSARWSL